MAKIRRRGFSSFQPSPLTCAYGVPFLCVVPFHPWNQNSRALAKTKPKRERKRGKTNLNWKSYSISSCFRDGRFQISREMEPEGNDFSHSDPFPAKKRPFFLIFVLRIQIARGVFQFNPLRRIPRPCLHLLLVRERSSKKNCVPLKSRFFSFLPFSDERSFFFSFCLGFCLFVCVGRGKGLGCFLLPFSCLGYW